MGLWLLLGICLLALLLGNGVLGTTTLDASQESTTAKSLVLASGDNSMAGLIILEPEEMLIQDLNLSKRNNASDAPANVVTRLLVEAVPNITIDTSEQVTESPSEINIEDGSSSHVDGVESIDNSYSLELYITLEESQDIDVNPLLPYITPGSLEIAK